LVVADDVVTHLINQFVSRGSSSRPKFEQRKRKPLRIAFELAVGGMGGVSHRDPLLVIDLVPFFEIVVSTFLFLRMDDN
jgi:hypothetical protein